MWILAGMTAAAVSVVRKLKRGGARRPADGAAVLLLAAFGVAIAQTIVLAALAVFARELDVAATGATWLLTAFMLASAIATPVAGRVGDLLGYRRVLLTGLASLLAGSVVAAVSTHLGSYAGVVAGRVLQGLSGGVFPCAFGLARQTVPAERLRGVVAALSAMFGVGGALGLVVAGPLVDATGPAALSWLVAAPALLCLARMGRLPSPPPSGSPAGRVDLAGAALLAGTLVALLLAISQGRAWGWTSPGIVVLFVAAVALGAGFALVERRVAAPLVDLRLLIGPRLLTTNVATLVVSAGMFAAITVLPLFAQTPAALGYGFGYSPTRTGLLMIPIAVCMLLAAPLTARLSGALGTRATFQAGAVLAAIALGGLGLLHDNIAQVLVWGAVLGLAYGLAFASLGGLVVGAVGQDQTGAATGVNTILRTVGGALGSVLAAVILASAAATPDRPPAESGYTTVFVVGGLIALCAAVVIATRSAATAKPGYEAVNAEAGEGR